GRNGIRHAQVEAVRVDVRGFVEVAGNVEYRVRLLTARVRARRHDDRQARAGLGRRRPAHLDANAIVDAVAIRVETGDLDPHIVRDHSRGAEDRLRETVDELLCAGREGRDDHCKNRGEKDGTETAHAGTSAQSVRARNGNVQ